MRSAEEIKAEYPLHWHIWHNELEQLQAAIDQVSERERGGCFPGALRVGVASRARC